MRIGVVTSSYPPHGGSFVEAHVEAMRALGHEVDVVHIPRASHGIPDELEGPLPARTRTVFVTSALFTPAPMRWRPCQ